MKTMPWLDVFEHPPTAVGWYATTVCWDVEEGIFPDAHYWNGHMWSDGKPIGHRSPETFPTKPQAEAWAYEHDPEK
jgi:hypothetical protein